MLKTHSCGELNRSHAGSKVTLAGWVDRRRDHGGLVFIDLRDREGIVQVVFNPETSKASHDVANGFRGEFVVQVTGTVSLRPEGTKNTNLPTGEIEVLADSAAVLNPSKTPPFYINEDVDVAENVRLKYRYLDLRRARMKENLLLRYQVTRFMRNFLHDRGFIEVETPILGKSTPEGARDYLVPSRLYPGKFYALPQSPQQMKQLLMVAGVEKYFQIARCFRDEDTRADRQPEFTQLDIEMSFVEEEDILVMMEELYSSMTAQLRPDLKFSRPFPRLTYADVMERFGSDKPDLRFGMEIKDLSDVAAQTQFSVFRSVLDKGGKVKGICAPACGDYSRAQLAELNDLVKSAGAQGLLTISLGAPGAALENLTMEAVKSMAAKYMTLEQVKQMAARLNAGGGDLILIVADKPEKASTVLGALRLEMGHRLGLADPKRFAFAFVVDFPLLQWSEEMGRWDSVHHPFTSPQEQDLAILESDPGNVLSRAYDMVCNGYELGGGSIRINKPDMQRRIFHLLGYDDKAINERFGHMLEAFEYGAPPHGGIAYGIDRFIMLLAGAESIREVISFPKNQNAFDLTFGAPDVVAEAQLKELHIRTLEEE